VNKFSFTVTATWKNGRYVFKKKASGTISEKQKMVGAVGALAVVLKDLFFDKGYISADSVTATIRPLKSKIANPKFKIHRSPHHE